jgi:hypothetical protein
MNADHMRTIVGVEPRGSDRLFLHWSDRTEAEVQLPTSFLNALGDDFRAVRLGDWGHSIEWPNGTEIGADSLWLETLAATGRKDARDFLSWRLANGLSLSKTAEALGLSRRTVAYYSNGDRPVPKTVQLACKGWDATNRCKAA